MHTSIMYVCMYGLTLIATYAIQPERRGANAEVAGHAVQTQASN
jgi:hypothetical protein